MRRAAVAGGRGALVKETVSARVGERPSVGNVYTRSGTGGREKGGCRPRAALLRGRRDISRELVLIQVTDGFGACALRNG